MGPQDVLVTSARGLRESRDLDSAQRRKLPKDSSSFLEDDLKTLCIQDDSNSNHNINNNNVTSLSVVSDAEMMAIYDDEDDDGRNADGSLSCDTGGCETDEGRLSRALQTWMQDYVLTPTSQMDPSFRQPVFSARLGGRGAIWRSDSSESTDTQISLFSCSSYGSQDVRRRKRRRRRKKVEPTAKQDATSSASTSKPGSAAAAGGGSRWEELAKLRKSELDRFMKSRTHALAQGFNLTEESEAFGLFEKDEQRALFECGKLDKLSFAAGLRKSGSMTNIKEPPPPPSRGKPKQRVASASANKSFGNPLDLQALKRQLMDQRLATLSHKSSRRRSLHRTGPRRSLLSTGSNDVHMSARTPRDPTPPLPATEPVTEKPVTVWKGDRQILAIDLNRELTAKVKQRIASTTTALERVTGVGEGHELRVYPAHMQEFPLLTEEDFAAVPRMPQKIRISPHLSEVIQSDIRVRMGRPRYHEIRVEDLDMWNRGQLLDRAHRNLKVFNWLHSLQEDQFDAAPLRQTVCDLPPDKDDVTFGEMVLVQAADEPDIKPLLERIRQNYIK